MQGKNFTEEKKSFQKEEIDVNTLTKPVPQFIRIDL